MQVHEPTSYYGEPTINQILPLRRLRRVHVVRRLGVAMPGQHPRGLGLRQGGPGLAGLLQVLHHRAALDAGEGRLYADGRRSGVHTD